MHKKGNKTGDSHDKRNDSLRFWENNEKIETKEKQKQNGNMKQQKAGELAWYF
jgi:hypothetical protein